MVIKKYDVISDTNPLPLIYQRRLITVIAIADEKQFPILPDTDLQAFCDACNKFANDIIGMNRILSFHREG